MVMEYTFNIEGIEKKQSGELIRNLRSIDGIEVYEEIKKIQVKEVIVPITIGIVSGVASGIIAHYIIKFFEKEKSKDNEPIVINCNHMGIVQGDKIEIIENKLNKIFNNSK